MKISNTGLPVKAGSLQSALVVFRVTQEFFADLGPIHLHKGEVLQDVWARCLGITRESFDETFRLLNSIAAGRVIPRVIIPSPPQE